MFTIKTPDGQLLENLAAGTVKEMIKQGQIATSTLARKEGFEEWKRVCTFPEFFAIVATDSRPPVASYSTAPFPIIGSVSPFATERANSQYYVRFEEGVDNSTLYYGSQIAQMIRDGAITLRTKAKKFGQEDWKALGTFPEFLGTPSPMTRHQFLD